MNERTITITLNSEEVHVLRQLLDAAVRHLGMGAAEAAVHIAAKLKPPPTGADQTKED